MDSRQSERDSNMNQTSQTRQSRPKTKLVVDKSIGDNKERGGAAKQGIFDTIKEAIESCEGPSIIRVTSFNYDEQLLIGKAQAGIVLVPKEKGGQVAILQKTNPCIVVDVGHGNKCTIKNIEMHLTGPSDGTPGESNTTAADHGKGERKHEEGVEAPKFETRGSE